MATANTIRDLLTASADVVHHVDITITAVTRHDVRPRAVRGHFEVSATTNGQTWEGAITRFRIEEGPDELVRADDEFGRSRLELEEEATIVLTDQRGEHPVTRLRAFLASLDAA